MQGKCFRGERPYSVHPSALFSIFLISISLFACVSTHSIASSGHDHVISGVPFYPQERNRCGPAALAGVMNFWDVKVSPSEIANEIYSDSAKGTLNIDMLVYPQKRGLRAQQYSGNTEDLKKKIDGGFPVIILVDYGFWVMEAGHFMVVTGYNDQGFFVNSERKRQQFISEKDLLKIWKKVDFCTLLIRPEPGK